MKPPAPSPAPALTRRRLVQLLGASPLLLPSGRARADDPAQRMFLFVFCKGGWDPTWVFADLLDSSAVDTEAGNTISTNGGLSWVSSPTRPTTESFFQTWGDRACIINGIEIRSITHEACRRIVLTGGTDTAGDDWPAILAGTAQGFVLPDLVVSGPAFTSQYSNSVMRVGPDGQLGKLLSGEVLDESDMPISPLSIGATERVAAYARRRAEAFAAAAGRGRATRVSSDLITAMDQLEAVRALDGGLDLGVEHNGWVYVSQRVAPVFDCFERGLTRCAVVEHQGEWDVGWDSHSGISAQADHYEVLFNDLHVIMSELASRTGPAGGSLLDQVTVVVMSEMGRAPTINARGGKDHWTFTSALLLGAGLKGGQVVGGFDETLVGQPMDLDSGEVDPQGTSITASSLGATLMALGGLDPAEHLDGVEPIRAILE